MHLSDDSEINEARRLLVVFEQKQTSSEGIACLINALAMLSDIIEDSNNEERKKTAKNIFDSHSNWLEKKILSLLAGLDDVPDEEIEKWFTAMQEFNDLPIQVSHEFRATLQQLIEALFDRYFKQLSQSQRAKILEDLKSRRKLTINT